MSRLLAILLLALVALALPVRGATFYIDGTVSTNGNGTSRATAWKEMSNVVWSSVSAGDTIKIAGATYQSELTFTKGGTPGSLITVMVDDDPTYYRDGVLLTGVGRVRLQGNSNIRLLGWAPGMDETGITNSLVTTNLLQRVGGRLNHTNGNANILAIGTLVSNITVRGWLVDGTVNTNSIYTNVMGQVVFHPNDTPGNSGIGSSASDNVGWDISFNVIRNLGQDAVGITASVPNTPDDVIISYNWIHDMGDDGIEITGGATVHGNRIERTSGQNGHPDLLVIVGDGNAVVARNYMYGFNTFFGPFYGVKYRTFSNYWVVGNVIQYAFTNAGDTGFGRTVDQTPANSETNYLATNPMIWRDNHTLYNTIVGSTPAATDVNRYRPNNTSNPAFNWIVEKQDLDEWVGNLFVDSGVASTVVGLSLKGNTDPDPNIGSGITYSPSVQAVLRMRDNILGSTNQYGRRVLLGTNLVPWTTIVDADAQFGTGPNYTNVPAFLNKGSFLELGDFRIPSTDTFAKAMGTNLTALGKPWLNVDFLGRPRPATGNWTIGAFEAEPSPETNLLVLLTFEDAFGSTTNILDSSGYNHHARQYGLSTNPAPNWPWRTNDARVGSYAGGFAPDYAYRPYTDTNFWSGRYAAIDSGDAFGRLTNMQKATIAAWVKFNSLPAGSNSTIAHNATVLDGGYGVRGAWHFGRYYSTSIGNMRFLLNTNAGAVAAAPQLTWDNGTYTNDTWNHYAITVDCSDSNLVVAKLYFNGSLLKSTNIALQAANAITGLRLTDAPGSTYGPWLAVGCWQHNGTQTLDDAADGLPNNGWMDGNMDDVRVYDRVLADSEVAAIYQSVSLGRIARAQTARIGLIRRPRRKRYEHPHHPNRRRASGFGHSAHRPVRFGRPGHQGPDLQFGRRVLLRTDRPGADRGLVHLPRLAGETGGAGTPSCRGNTTHAGGPSSTGPETLRP